MIHVLLTVLKILGILLASIIGLLLLILLIVLLVPVRYRGKAQKHDKINADGVVSWLLHIVHCSVKYEGDGVITVVRIFGIKVYPKSEKKPSKERKSSKKRKPKKRPDEDKEKTEDKTEEKAEDKTEDKAEDKVEGKAEDKGGNGTVCSIADTVENSEVEIVGIGTEDLQDVPNCDDLSASDDIGDSVQEHLTIEEKIEKIEDKIDELLDDADEKTQAAVDKIKKKLSDIAEKLTNIYNKAELVLELTGDERIRRALKLTKKQVGKLLKAVLPRKMSGNAHYGFADPSTTGYVTAALAAVYGRIGKSFSATPDFENEVLEGDVSFKGRIMLGRIVGIALKVVLNRDCRYSYKLIKKIKEND